MRESAPRTVGVHLGLAWKFRNTRNCETGKTHIVRLNDDAPDPLPHRVHGVDHGPYWHKLCDGHVADERRPGWAEDVNCPKCRRILSVEQERYDEND